MDGKSVSTKHVTITRVVPVNDMLTLEAWLNRELEDWLKDKRDGGASKATAGSKALTLIREAGFAIQSPVTTR